MELIHHQDTDVFHSDPFASLPNLHDLVKAVDTPKPFPEVESEFPATAVQCGIIREEIQWSKTELTVPHHPLPALSAVIHAWNQVASHHASLRAHLCIAGTTPTVRVLRRVEDIVLASEPGARSDDRLAHVSLQAVDRGDVKIWLNFRRALIDASSLAMIKLDFALVVSGLPPREHIGIATYARFLSRKEDVEHARQFWSATLEGTAPPPTFAITPPGIAGSLTGGRARHSVTAVVDSLSRESQSGFLDNHGFSRKTFFEALWAVVLSAHSGAEDVTFGTVGRDNSFFGAESCTGCLDQTYLLRLNVSIDSTISHVATSIDTFHAEAAPLAFLGFDGIRQHLPPEKVIESVLVYAEMPSLPCIAPGLKSFPLVMTVCDTGRLKLTLTYVDDIKRAEAEILLQHFVSAIQSAASKANFRGAAIRNTVELVSADERDRLHTAAGSPCASEPTTTTIPALFEAAASQYPSRVAVEVEGAGTTLTFSELDRISSSLANVLQLSRGDIVPLLIDRSEKLIIAMLAVLRSGAAYTILDPESPSQRNSQIIEDCAAPLVLANSKYKDRFPQCDAIEDCLARAAAPPSSVSDGLNHEARVRAEDVCYIIYTSGSTGKPKGAVLTHAAAANGMLHHSLNGLDRWLLFYNPTFSAAQRTMLSTLVHGGTLVMASKERLSTNLAEVVNEARIDALGITPSALSLLQPTHVPRVKQITLVGERIPESLVDAWAAARADLVLRNTYGLSECTQLNFGRRLEPGGNARAVGERPADTTRAYVLCPGTVRLAPIGVTGELCLAGPQLASGYLNRPELSARVFVDNPFGLGRLYRTGDLARRRPSDGQVEVLGRMDLQVKIGGQKVEPAEIDNVLLRHPHVAACVTVPVEIDDRTLLVAAIVLAEDQKQQEKTARWGKEILPSLKAHAREMLPGYMVPSLWLPLDEIPKNANGKINFHQLRNMSQELGLEGFASMCGDDGGDPVTDELEAKIAKAWAAVLGISHDIIKRHHSFSSLGGSSIQAIRVMSGIRHEGIFLEFSDVLSDQGLKELASKVVVSEDGDNIPREPESFSLFTDVKILGRLRQDMKLADVYPATPLQAGLLTTMAKDVDDPYVYRRVWKVVDGVDVDKLRRSFEQVFEARDILRTGFIPHRKSFLQLVREDLTLPWHESLGSLDGYLEEDKKRELPMSGPLFRVGLVSGTYIVVTMHHSLFDFWSHGFLYQDVAAVYEGASVPDRPGFRNFVKHIAEQNKAASRAFWSTHLEGVPDGRLNSEPSDETSKVRREVSPRLSERARNLGISLGAAVYAAWAVILSHHLSADDVVFATTISGRELPVLGVERMDGPTMTTVPQRIKLEPSRSLLDLAKEVMANFLDVAKHSQLGMQETLKAGKLKNGSLDTLVNILVKDTEVTDGDQSVFRRHGERPVWVSEFTVLEVEEGETGSGIRLSGRMEPKRLEFLCDSFVRVISLIFEQPDTKSAAVDILGDTERTFLRNTLSNRDSLRVPTPQLLHSAFERYARDHPDHVAIDWDSEQQVTYSELDRRASGVARLLISRGTKPGGIVALMLDKSVETIVCILGVMKAGAAYVPLNPENPIERNRFIIEDAGAQLVVVHKQHCSFVEHVGGLEAVVVEDSLQNSSEEPGQEAVFSEQVSVTPDSLAYLIYTSGSTGRPKGVKVPHRSAAAAVSSMADAEGRHHGEWRALQFANYVFDASVQDIFNTLSTGGTLCMAPTEKLLTDAAACINRMDAKQVIVTPTVASLLQPEQVPGLEKLIVGGEPMTSAVVEKWQPECDVLNVYGPTETAMVVTTKLEEDPESSRLGNIGKPFPTVMAFIVDGESDRLVPYGAVGELCIAGEQVTDGYMNRDDLTDAAFVKSEALGATMYRTGDLARWLPGGEVECLGRKDNQVKIHGHRIELGEVEHAMRQSGLIEDAVALLATINGKPQLVAVCIFEDAATDSLEIQAAEEHAQKLNALKERLGSLATYMVPKFVLPVGDFPKLPSRKVDRKALKKRVEELGAVDLGPYSLDMLGQSHEVVACETPAEKALEQMWADVLGLPAGQIGREANFLSLGGDSISAISLSSSSRLAGFELTVPNILKYGKLRDLAATMRETEKADVVPETVTFEVPAAARDVVASAGLHWDEDVEYVYPCPPGQVEFLEQGDRDEQVWVLQTIRRMAPEDDQEKWIAATSTLTEVNDILRTSWMRMPDNNGWLGVVLRSSELNLARFRCTDDEEARKIFEDFWSKRFIFGEPFVKYAVVTYPDESWDLVIKMNHAAYDGTLLRILDDHFGAILQGREVPKHGQFRDFALHVFRSDKEKALRHWAEKLTGQAETQKNSDDGKSPPWAAATSPKITASVRMPMDIAPGIDSVAQRLGVTPSIIFQGAFQLWLARATGGGGVGFDYLLSGRNVALPDPQTINGTLANFLPIRVGDIDPAAPLAELLERTQDDFWAMTEHGEVGLVDIYRAAGLARQDAGNKVLFLFQPFEPTVADTKSRWLVMAKSEVRMLQPYALVVEVSKAPGNRHKLAVMYDDTIFSEDRAREIGKEITDIVDAIVREGDDVTDMSIGDIVDSQF